MGQTGLILSLALAILVAVFAVQNGRPVTLTFGLWSLETSLVVVILAAAAAGAVAASLLGLPGWIRDRRRLRHQAREIEALKSQRLAGPGRPAGPPANAPPAPPHLTP
ncbi:MAG: lipopolysaccharide assembly protein LapA domain-containing protein [Candidatus Methylomirabilales bacterium]